MRVFLTTFIQDFDNDNSSDCIGFEVTAITILETAESYVNILLGDYKEPEVVLLLKVDLMIMTGLLTTVLTIQLRWPLSGTALHQQTVQRPRPR